MLIRLVLTTYVFQHATLIKRNTAKYYEVVAIHMSVLAISMVKTADEKVLALAQQQTLCLTANDGNLNRPFVITAFEELAHSGQVTHICVSKLTIIISDNGLLPGRRQAIIWTNAGILLTDPLETSISETVIEIYTFSLTKMHLEMLSILSRPQGLVCLKQVSREATPKYHSIWGM